MSHEERLTKSTIEHLQTKIADTRQELNALQDKLLRLQFELKKAQEAHEAAVADRQERESI